jgi:tRNA threonylcarbamoyladenosine biosynthesis protein TsaB
MDTSSKVTSLCVTRNGEVVKSLNGDFDENRSEKLWVEIQRMLEDAGLTIDDVDLLAACVGPGGFTGLRVGLAAAKGFAAAAGRPLAGVTSLQAAAAAGRAPLVLALVNAYKGEVYSQLFSCEGDGAPVALNEAIVSTFRLALDRVAHIETVVFVGNAAVENAEEIKKLTDETRRDGTSRGVRVWTIQEPDTSTAEAIARLALLRYREGDALDAVTACYVRRPEAEIKLAKGLLGSKIDRVRRQL